jgi:hypothetical protein
MVISLPLVYCRDGVFVGCILDKHHWDNFNKCASWHALAPLHLVHSDLCGPLPSPSFFVFKYFLTFIDELPKCICVYFLKLKREVFGMLFVCKALVEKQSRHQLQKLRINNGHEYVNNKFTTYYTTQNIHMQHIVPYTSQQNGIVERNSSILKEMTKCMIQFKETSLQFWEKAINRFNYIFSHTPTKDLKDITLEEA